MAHERRRAKTEVRSSPEIVLGSAADGGALADLSKITDRERDILRLAASGMTDKGIAHELGLTVGTVRTYWVRVRSKIGQSSRSELVAKFVRSSQEHELAHKEHENLELREEIVKQREIERRLRQDADLLDTIGESLGVALWIVDSDHGRVIFVNQAFEWMFNVSRDQLLTDATCWMQHVDPEDLLQAKLIADWSGPGPAQATCRLTMGDDELRWVEMHAFPTTSPSTGTPRKLVIGREVTEQVEATKALHDSLSRYQFLVDHCPEMITRHDLPGHYLFASPACKSILGYRPDELIGRLAYELFHPDDVPAITRSHETVLRGATAYRVKYRARHKEGHFVWLESVSKTIRDGQGVPQEIVVFTCLASADESR